MITGSRLIPKDPAWCRTGPGTTGGWANRRRREGLYTDLLSQADESGPARPRRPREQGKKFDKATITSIAPTLQRRTDPAPGSFALVDLYGLRQELEDSSSDSGRLAQRFSSKIPMRSTLKGGFDQRPGQRGAIPTYNASTTHTDSTPVLSRSLWFWRGEGSRECEPSCRPLSASDPKQPAEGPTDPRREAEPTVSRQGSQKRVAYQDDPGSSVFELRFRRSYREKARRDHDTVVLLEKAVATPPSDDDLVRCTGSPLCWRGGPGEAGA